MEPLVRTTPDEATALAMENELLRYEVRHLRARLAAAQKGAPQGQPEGGQGAPAAAGQDTAREDLVWLLERLDSSPAGPLFRGRAGFRTLRAKYLGGSAG